ncbi:MAG: type VI secretion system baseplate subunit TssG, partial [Calditrichaceae bacterium]
LAEKLLIRWYPEIRIERFEQTGIKIRPYEHYTYYPVNIRGFRYQENKLEFILNFYGLYGPDSPLPRCYHEEVSLQRKLHRSGSPLQDFFDIFNNRFYWLYYQAWKKYRYYLQITDDPNNKILQQIFTFIGMGPDFFQEKPSLNIYKLLQLSGTLSTRVRNKKGLLILLKEFWPQFKFSIKEFVASQVKIDSRPILGSNKNDKAFILGQYSIIGNKIFDYMSRICIEIGPMNFEDYSEFMPGGKYIRIIQELLHIYLNDNLEYDIKCIIHTDSILKVSWSDKRVRLGQSFWLGRPEQQQVEMYLKYEDLMN